MTVAFYVADKEGSKTLHFESTSKIFEFSPKKKTNLRSISPSPIH